MIKGGVSMVSRTELDADNFLRHKWRLEIADEITIKNQQELIKSKAIELDIPNTDLDGVYTAKTNKGKVSQEFEVINGKFTFEGQESEFKIVANNDLKYDVTSYFDKETIELDEKD